MQDLNSVKVGIDQTLQSFCTIDLLFSAQQKTSVQENTKRGKGQRYPLDLFTQTAETSY